MTALLARRDKPTAGASMRRERVEASVAAELETTAVIRDAIPVLMIKGEIVLWQQTFLVSPRQKSRATCHWEPRARINEVVYYLLRCGTIELPLLELSAA
jgi:hypothetical protein